MRKLIVLLVLIVLIGCNTQTEEEKNELCKKDCLSDGWQYGRWVGINFCNCYNNTLIINNTIQPIKFIDRNITITEKCNITNNTIKYEYTGTTSRELELIRRIGFLESQQDKYWNYSECDWELNKSNKGLKDCEDNMCYWNSTWC